MLKFIAQKSWTFPAICKTPLKNIKIQCMYSNRAVSNFNRTVKLVCYSDIHKHCCELGTN